MNVRKAFYKAQTDSLSDLTISLYTWLFNPFTKPYSHEEIGFPKEALLFEWDDLCEKYPLIFYDFDNAPEWFYFSSSARDGGTRWKRGDDLLKNLQNWDVMEKDWSEINVRNKILRARSIEDLPYDYLGIFGFVTLTGQINNWGAWYCSETCHYVDWGEWLKRVSPRRDSTYSIKDRYIYVPKSEYLKAYR